MFLGVIRLERGDSYGLEKTLHLPASVFQFLFCKCGTEDEEADIDRSLSRSLQLHAAFLDGIHFLTNTEIDQHPLLCLYHFLSGKLRLALGKLVRGNCRIHDFNKQCTQP